jgi:hypothetical protein
MRRPTRATDCEQAADVCDVLLTPLAIPASLDEIDEGAVR